MNLPSYFFFFFADESVPVSVEGRSLIFAVSYTRRMHSSSFWKLSSPVQQLLLFFLRQGNSTKRMIPTQRGTDMCVVV